MVAALVFAVVGVAFSPLRSPVFAVGTVATVVLVAVVVGRGVLPDVRNEAGKLGGGGPGVEYSEWGPVFRVDVTGPLPSDPENRMLIHDGNPGSGLWPFDGDLASLTRYERDPRAIPFDILGGTPGRELIIGSAGGNEILASLYFRSQGHRGRRAQPRDRLAPGGPLCRLHRALGGAARGRIAPRRRAVLLGPPRHELRPGVVPRARQLRRHQRRHLGRLRVVRELPLHHRDDRADPRPPHRRRDHGRAVRRVELRGATLAYIEIHHDRSPGPRGHRRRRPH